MKQNLLLMSTTLTGSLFQSANGIKSHYNVLVSLKDEDYRCTRTLERALHGSSNSKNVWMLAKNSEELWEDPEFPADESSIEWPAKWGSEGDIQKFKPSYGEISWARPNEIYKDGKSSLWGDAGFPLPQGT